jgi:hypothetical protein
MSSLAFTLFHRYVELPARDARAALPIAVGGGLVGTGGSAAAVRSPSAGVGERFALLGQGLRRRVRQANTDRFVFMACGAAFVLASLMDWVR